ncbi:UNVERIFIED_CONTAM: hypothetical protein FKN15_014602 [Acipenser sinensis]
MVGGPPSPKAEGRSVHSPAPSWRDRDLAKGDPGALDGASGAQAGDQSAAAPGRGASPGDSAATSGQPGGAEQETRRPPVPGGAATWESGPATKGPDMEPGCPGAQAEGSNPQAPGCGTGVVSSPPPLLRLAVTPGEAGPSGGDGGNGPSGGDGGNGPSGGDGGNGPSGGDGGNGPSGGDGGNGPSGGDGGNGPSGGDGGNGPSGGDGGSGPSGGDGSSSGPSGGELGRGAPVSAGLPSAAKTVAAVEPELHALVPPPKKLGFGLSASPLRTQDALAPSFQAMDAPTPPSRAVDALTPPSGPAARLPLVAEAGTAARFLLVVLLAPPTAGLELVALPAPPTAGFGLVAGVSAGLPSAAKTVAAVEPELHALVPPPKKLGFGLSASPLRTQDALAPSFQAMDAPTPPSRAVDALTPPSGAVDVQAPHSTGRDRRQTDVAGYRGGTTVLTYSSSGQAKLAVLKSLITEVMRLFR